MRLRLLAPCVVLIAVQPTLTPAVTIDMVTVGNPGNAGDVQSQGTFGAVGNNYRIGKTEVTNAQYVDFLNGVAASDPYQLYNANMGSQPWGGIARSDSSGSYSYSIKADAVGQGPGGTDYSYRDKPVVFVSWYDAIRFANWLHNGQGSGDTESGAYMLLGGTPTPSNGNSITRNPGARWWLPSEDEWYKAAYFDPSGVYYDYPTATNSVPNNNLPSADTGNSANFVDLGHTTGNLSYPMTDGGAYALSESPYGTFDQGGNVWEWNEAVVESSFRGLRGGSWNDYSYNLRADFRGYIFDPSYGDGVVIGFRVASIAIPEPSTLLLLCFGSLAVLWRRRGLVCASILAAAVGISYASTASAVPLYHIVPVGPDRGGSPFFLSEAGQVVGTSSPIPSSGNYGVSVWVYDGTTTVELGFTGPEHTRDDGYQYSEVAELNQAGQVLGSSQRYPGTASHFYPGYSAWLYNGATTIKLGFTGPEYTTSGGFQNSKGYGLNAAGQVAGWSVRYNNGGGGIGAWLYNGTTTIELGFTGPEYTGDYGYKYSAASGPNEAGQVAGYSQRIGGVGGGSAWFYNGTTTINISLTGSEYTRNDGYQYSSTLRLEDGGLNEAGQVSGFSYRYNGGSANLGQTAWLYDGTTTMPIGLTDSEHTRNDGYRISIPFPDGPNEAGQVIGTSYRYNSGSADLGRTTWLYNGATTTDVGLTGSEYTRNDGYKRSVLSALNEAGQVLGYSELYNGGSTQLGQSIWLYNGATTAVVGLTGPEHTRNDGYKYSASAAIANARLNEAGQLLGYSDRYNGGSTKLGQSAWLYNGATTIELGLTGPEYTSSDGYKYSEVRAWNKAGQVAGYSLRFSGCPCDYGSNGQSAWLYDGATTIELGLTGPEYTRSDGYKLSSASAPNEAGLVIGTSLRYSRSTSLGQDAWFYDLTLQQTIPLQLSTRSDGYAYSSAYVSKDGVVLGTYTLFDALDNDLGDRAFYFTVAEGMHDLGFFVDGGLAANGWDYLASTIRANGLGQILGYGKLTSQSAGRMAYLLTPIVPEPSTLLLLCFGSLAVLWRRRLVCASILAAVVSVSFADRASADTFGSGANTFDIEFVTIGNPGNAADDASASPDFAGSVPYTYRMGKYEVSRDMVTKANSAGGLGITLADMTLFGGNGVNRPASSVTWNEAARFVNWLNTSQGFQAAYKFTTQPGDGGYGANQNIVLWVSGDAGFNAANPFRNTLAHFFLPSVDEWYKAAFYNPTSGVYYDYATGSDSVPTTVASGMAAGTAVYDGQDGPADITLAGGLSPYGTMAQNGNASEWEETESDLMNDSASSVRGERGSSWEGDSFRLLSSTRFQITPTNENPHIGFRVASNIPEPSTLLLLCFGSLAVFWRRRAAS